MLFASVNTFFKLLKIINKTPFLATNFRHWNAYHCISVLFFIWMLIALVSSITYSNVFYSIMTIPRMEKSITSQGDLLEALEKKGYYLLATKLFSETVKGATPANELYFRLGKYINK